MVQRASLILMLLLQACGGMRLHALPDPAAEPDRTGQAISTRLAEVDATIQAEAWHHRPRRLTRDFLPFLVRIANRGRSDATLRIAEIALTDDHGRIRHPLRPEEVISLLLGGSDASAIIPSIGVEASGPEPTIFGLELGINWGRYRDLREIQRLAFPLEPIPAGSSAEGFIYFPNPPPDARRLTLRVTLDAPSGRQELLFSFAIDH
jgi:hypothetical protein